MTLIVPEQRGEAPSPRSPDARVPVLAALQSIPTRRERDTSSVPDDVVEDEPVLTSEDVARLRCEGRNAAFEGMTLRSCPYSTASRARREAWIEGFNTVK